MKDIYAVARQICRLKMQDIAAKNLFFDTNQITFSELWLDGHAKVIDVDYDLPDDLAFGPAGINLLRTDEAKPEIVASDYICNMSDLEQSVSSTLSGSVTTSESWNISESVETGVEAEISIACLIADSNIKTHINRSVTKDHSWGTEKSQSWEKSLTMNVPAKSSGKCSLIAYKRDLEINFTMKLELVGKLITKMKFPVFHPTADGSQLYGEEEHHFILDNEPKENKTIELKGVWKGTGCFGGHILFENA